MHNCTRRVVARFLTAGDATSIVSNKIYYHGTPSERAGKSILRFGIEPPDLTMRGDAFRPVMGRVYLTPHLSWGMLYALGGEIAATFMENRVRDTYPKSMWEGSEWGYLFVVPGKVLTKVHPDEDSVGAMLADGTAPKWLDALARKVLTDMHPEVRPDAPETHFIPDFLERSEWEELAQQNLYDLSVEPGFFQLQAQAVAGKVLLNAMTPTQEFDLLTRGAHVAHDGTVVPTECWRIRKMDASLLKRDGSNFFQVAERVR
jgi:hypothetical protein